MKLRRMTLRRVIVLGALLVVNAGAVLAGASSSARADDATTDDGPHGVIAANVESFAARIEYDIPLPVGTGTVAQVVGEIRSSAGGENAKGIAGSPSSLDPVVGGKFSDPQGTGHPENRYPQTECFYPGSLLDTAFSFPTDERKETSQAPAIGYASSRCAAGPTVELHSHIGGDKTQLAAPGLSVMGTASDAIARPVKGVLDASTASHATNVSLLDGAITIGDVVARGESQITGQPGGGASKAVISLTDINAGGVTFSLNNATVNGTETAELVIGGQSVPADSSAAAAVLAAANTALHPTGCSIAVLTSPDRYPQGFLFSRPEPAVGVQADGNSAGSYRGGLLVLCDIPRSISEPSTFNPQRAQILVGFAYTGTALKPGDDSFSIGGFDTGDLLGGPLGSLVTEPPTITPVAAAPADLPAPAAAPAVVEQAAPERVSAPAAILPKHLSASTKWILGLLSLVLWVPLTHIGARRLRLALADGADA